MKTWKEKVLVPRYGVCTVKEASDKEATGQIAPRSHGFVNLFQRGKFVDFCGIFFAEEHKITRRSQSKKD